MLKKIKVKIVTINSKSYRNKGCMILIFRYLLKQVMISYYLLSLFSADTSGPTPTTFTRFPALSAAFAPAALGCGAFVVGSFCLAGARLSWF